MKLRLLALIAVCIFAVTGCTGSPAAQESDTGDPEVTLNVQAAASLQKSFTEIAEAFTAEHPHIAIDFNFAGSSTLVQHLEAGAPADIFASADETTMDRAADADLLDGGTREVFTANLLVGIVPADNPAEISSLQEANADTVQLVTCAPQVPCGALAQTLANSSGLSLNPVSEEQQVSDVLGKVRSGQADAGLVYATDAALAPTEVDTFDIDGAEDHLNKYPIARTAQAEHPDAAAAFIAFVTSETGQTILETNGFTTP